MTDLEGDEIVPRTNEEGSNGTAQGVGACRGAGVGNASQGATPSTSCGGAAQEGSQLTPQDRVMRNLFAALRNPRGPRSERRKRVVTLLGEYLFLYHAPRD